MVKFILSLLALTLVSCTSTNERTPLFNGKDLSGWQGDEELWQVKDGVIVGSTFDKTIPSNRFLSWESEVENFELTFEAKVEGENNSGVMYRSQPHDKEKLRLKGNQCDIHPKPEYCAMLYSEATGRKIIAERGTKVKVPAETGEPQVLWKSPEVSAVDISKWQTYKIVAQGNKLQHYVNGELAMELTDNHKDIALRGILALQLHRGKPMKAYFKNIYLKNL